MFFNLKDLKYLYVYPLHVNTVSPYSHMYFILPINLPKSVKYRLRELSEVRKPSNPNTHQQLSDII